MTRRKARLQLFVAIGAFVIFFFAGVVAILEGLMSVQVWERVLLIGSIVALAVIATLALRTGD
jgi:hypothetical protein